MDEQRDRQAAHGGSQGAGEVKPGAVEGDGIRQLRAGNHLRHNRLPRGAVHGRADIQQEGKNQQDPGRDDVEEREHAEDGDGRQHPRLPENEQPAAIENIRRRPRQQAQNDHRQAGRGLHQGDEQGGRGEHRHQPGAGRILHPSAQVGHNGGQPQIAKKRHRKRLKAVELGFRLQLICLQGRHGE